MFANKIPREDTNSSFRTVHSSTNKTFFLIYYNCITANSMTNEMRRMYVNKTF